MIPRHNICHLYYFYLWYCVQFTSTMNTLLNDVLREAAFILEVGDTGEVIMEEDDLYVNERRIAAKDLPGTFIHTPYGSVSIEDVKMEDRIVELVVRLLLRRCMIMLDCKTV